MLADIPLPVVCLILASPLAVVWLIAALLGMRYIPNNRVGVVEKLWSVGGSVGGGRIIALSGEAGYQARLLRGGVHLRLWRWQYRIHRAPLVTVPQGKIAYVYARDGDPLPPGQTLARVVECDNFQNADAFLKRKADSIAKPDLSDSKSHCPPRPARPSRAIIREGAYAINPALFVVIAEDRVYHLGVEQKQELQKLVEWQKELREQNGFSP